LAPRSRCPPARRAPRSPLSPYTTLFRSLFGYEPAFIQAGFRVGDSATQVITPLNPYMIVLLGLVRRYESDAGLGTVISRMFPFVDRKSTRLNSSHVSISYAVFCLKKKKE